MLLLLLTMVMLTMLHPLPGCLIVKPIFFKVARVKLLKLWCNNMHMHTHTHTSTQVDRKITAEEAAKMAKAMIIDGQKRVVEKVLGRRKLKSSYEYEVRRN